VRRRPSPSLGALVVAVASLAAVARPAVHKDGPPLAHTGGFGEPTCQECHFDGALNQPGGELAIGGVPSGYQPGRSYVVTVSLRRAAMLRAGFQLAARLADGAAAGTQGGALAPTDQRTAVVRDSANGVLYAQHTSAGTTVRGGAASWMVRWTAPAQARGAVVLHVAANAANDDDSPLGDFIYTSVVRVLPERR
jgi:hypothetical protein